MDIHSFKGKITKRDFQHKLIDTFGHKNLTASPYDENSADADGNPTINHMTLYYNNVHHVGTWMKGEGWIFKNQAN